MRDRHWPPWAATLTSSLNTLNTNINGASHAAPNISTG